MLIYHVVYFMLHILHCFTFLLLFFFFFKQKTAYEMRISDWSSDVCSSDLFGLQHAVQSGQRNGTERQHQQRKRRRQEVAEEALFVRKMAAEGHEIGRASCRERVCQYV